MAGNWGQIEWMKALKNKYPKRFKDKDVLEIGSLDVNGSIRGLFENCGYNGLDVAPGAAVNIVSIAHEYKTDKRYDVVCSANALEHDMHWRKTLRKMYELTRPGGLMWFVACSNWEEHGTKRTSPEQSLTTTINEEWANYYKNLDVKDVMSVLGKLKFKSCKAEINPFTDIDVCFWGIK